jgi:hypothetical protein
MTQKMPLHLSRAAAAAAAVPAGRPSAELLRHGTLELRWFAPPAIGLDHDPQKPHRRDEVYIVVSGTGGSFVGRRAWLSALARRCSFRRTCRTGLRIFHRILRPG